MKTSLSVLFCLWCSLLCSQQVSIVEGFYANAVYSPSKDKIYALSRPDSPNGNSICRIDPFTANVEACFFVGSDPQVIAITEDNASIYVGLNGENNVARFDLATEQIDLTFSTGGEGDFLGPFYAEEILPLPGQADRVAISLRNACCSPRHEGVAIFEDGVQQMMMTPDHTGSNTIARTDVDDYIIGYNNETTDFALRRMSVGTSGGINVEGEYQFFDGFGHRIEYADGELYATSGQRVSLNDGVPTAAGRYVFSDVSFGTRSLEVFPADDRVLFLRQNFDGYTLEVFNRTTSVLIEERRLTALTLGDVRELISWGGLDKLAFVTDQGALVIVLECVSAVTLVPPTPTYAENTGACFGQDAVLVVPDSIIAMGEILWSTGDEGDSLIVSENGEYSYALKHASGCAGPFSPSFFVNFEFPPSPPFLTTDGNNVVCQGGSVVIRNESLGGTPVLWSTGETTDVITVTEGGTYTAQQLSPTGCISEPSNPIIITESTEVAPTAPELNLSGIVDTCSNTPITLVATPGQSSYRWLVNGFEVQRNNTIEASPQGEGQTFQVRAENESGCIGPLSEEVTINFVFPPLQPTVEYNAAANLLASSFSGTNRWYLNGSFIAETENNFFAPTESGFYSVEAVGNCVSVRSELINVVVTSTDDPVLRAMVDIYPNPASEFLYISVEDATLNYGVQLFNLQGQRIRQSQNIDQLALTGIPTGTYVLLLSDLENGRRMTTRIVVD